ncbi:type VI secretion system baseplate subunit TssF [Rubrivivax gelatinosus]|uniref:Type VI secretion system protein ImpG n=1 Tax=Rubrivivax gelatinosus TaxID=28068 RepID=A0A4R2ME24_RUBGE|nr:type VI secretion system baseplate subunit TssF [Rubrivivax gelatinosus]MBK1687555.1 type VI secretion system ImpG/VasA family protein [Rubrivivax gelatinosus]TCP02927.1 type VI secretion system protein ImpG [Rubrivivax gelatinosus]
MQALLPHYERELAWFDEASKAFARRYPRIAGRLAAGGELAQDPHVERLIQAFSLLAARLHRRLDEDLPRMAETLLELLHPLALRPFPSCSIVRFDAARSLAQLSTARRIPRGTLLHSTPVQGVSCRFTTAYELALAPLRVAAAAIGPPARPGLPAGAAAAWFSVRLELLSPAAQWATLDLPCLRLFLDLQPSQAAALREALFERVRGVWLDDGNGAARPVAGAAPRPVGLADDEALLDGAPRERGAERLLAEYFAFPCKFDFVDLPLPAALRHGQSRSVTLHYALAERPRARAAGWPELEGIGAGQLLPGCTPVVNAFRQRAEPIRVTQAREAYPVVVDARHPGAYEVLRVDRVRRIRQDARGAAFEDLPPLYSLRHASATAAGSSDSCFWSLRRDAERAELAPGHEAELTLVDMRLDPALAAAETLSVDVTAGNRDLPSQLPLGRPGGDLQADDGGLAEQIVLLRRPTPGSRPVRLADAPWRLVSLLALDRCAAADGLERLREWLALHDPGSDASGRGLASSLLSAERRPALAWLPGPPAPCLVRGSEIRLVVDEAAFVGSGVGLFGRLLAHALALRAPVNGFTRLTLHSGADGALLYDGGLPRAQPAAA